jgi:hypothetical protein
MNAAVRLSSQANDLGLIDLRRTKLDPRITFSRASQKTYFDKAGVMQTAANDVWPVEFDPVTGRCLGRSVWPARTNLLLYSQEFDNAAWLLSSATITANAAAAPDGTMTVDRLIEDATNNVHQVRQAATYAVSTTYALSVFVAQSGTGSLRNVQLIMQTTAGGFITQHFDLTAGTVGTTATSGAFPFVLVAARMFPVPGGYRCVLIATSGSTAGAGVAYFRMLNGTAQTYLGDGVSSLYLWGAQLEAGWYETSYIPTTAASATRAVDIAKVSTLSSLGWNASAGTVLFRGTSRYEDDGSNTSAMWSFWESNVLFWTARLDLTTTRTGQVFILYRGDTQYQIEGDTNDYAPGLVPMKFATSFQSSAAPMRLAIDGETETTTSGVFPAVPPLPSELRIGHGNNTTTSVFGGWIRSLRYWPRFITDAELQEASS